jgi:hypothetical protein
MYLKDMEICINSIVIRVTIYLWHKIGFDTNTHKNLKTMKKLILVAVLGIAAATYQPAKAQVSISLSIGTPSYYGYNSYYEPAPVVYVERHHRNYYPQRNVVVYRPQPVVRRSYYTNYRPSNRYYSVKQVNYKHYNKSNGHSKGHGRGRH